MKAAAYRNFRALEVVGLEELQQPLPTRGEVRTKGLTTTVSAADDNGRSQMSGDEDDESTK